LPFPSPGDLPDPRIEPGSPTLLADALPSEPPGKSRDAIGSGANQRAVERSKNWEELKRRRI